MIISRSLHALLVVILVLLINTKPMRTQNSSFDLIQTLLDFLQQGRAVADLENMDNDIILLKEYDFIVVGAGTAGCAMAARLSENPKWKVLLLEAGGPESIVMDVPVIALLLQLSEINWKYRAQPSNSSCQGMNNQRCNMPRGKVMGGSSVLNYMIYSRGNPRDYDRWAKLGNEGWSFKDVLPYFQKYEGSTVPDAEKDFVGRDGPVRVSYINYRSEIAKAFVAAAQQDGLKYRDYNGLKQVGVSYLQTTTYEGIRWSANRAYLYPLKGRRSNLHIKKFALVTKVLIDPETKVAQGVLFSSEGKSYKVLAKREVILSAGAINSPQLLMLSGIGPAKHLRDVGIKPIVDLAVGFNFQDHIAPVMSFSTNATTLKLVDFFNLTNIVAFMNGEGLFVTPGSCETIAFWELDNPAAGDDGWPDIELFTAAGLSYVNPAMHRSWGLTQETFDAINAEVRERDGNGFMIFPMILRPKSRGRLMLKSKDPRKFPLIYPHYLKDPYDVHIVVRGLQKTFSLLDQPAFKAINVTMIGRELPGCEKFVFNTTDYWECYARHLTLNIFHYSGTAKMGPATDRTAVVDPRLRVYGVKNLRVVDGSIMPEIIAGHTNGPIFMIAEKAADMIKEDYNFISKKKRK